jgi:hypothetical protein
LNKVVIEKANLFISNIVYNTIKTWISDSHLKEFEKWIEWIKIILVQKDRKLMVELYKICIDESSNENNRFAYPIVNLATLPEWSDKDKPMPRYCHERQRCNNCPLVLPTAHANVAEDGRLLKSVRPKRPTNDIWQSFKGSALWSQHQIALHSHQFKFSWYRIDEVAQIFLSIFGQFFGWGCSWTVHLKLFRQNSSELERQVQMTNLLSLCLRSILNFKRTIEMDLKWKRNWFYFSLQTDKIQNLFPRSDRIINLQNFGFKNNHKLMMIHCKFKTGVFCLYVRWWLARDRRLIKLR